MELDRPYLNSGSFKIELKNSVFKKKGEKISGRSDSVNNLFFF